MLIDLLRSQGIKIDAEYRNIGIKAEEYSGKVTCISIFWDEHIPGEIWYIPESADQKVSDVDFTLKETNLLRVMWVASKGITQQTSSFIESEIKAGKSLKYGIQKAVDKVKNNEDRIFLGTMIVCSTRLSERTSGYIAERIRNGANLSSAIRHAM